MCSDIYSSIPSWLHKPLMIEIYSLNTCVVDGLLNSKVLKVTWGPCKITDSNIKWVWDGTRDSAFLTWCWRCLSSKVLDFVSLNSLLFSTSLKSSVSFSETLSFLLLNRFLCRLSLSFLFVFVCCISLYVKYIWTWLVAVDYYINARFDWQDSFPLSWLRPYLSLQFFTSPSDLNLLLIHHCSEVKHIIFGLKSSPQYSSYILILQIYQVSGTQLFRVIFLL